ncbi:hypothetical protein VTK26DRAFT_7667 [Humicola hyalothermophila]
MDPVWGEERRKPERNTNLSWPALTNSQRQMQISCSQPSYHEGNAPTVMTSLRRGGTDPREKQSTSVDSLHRHCGTSSCCSPFDQKDSMRTLCRKASSSRKTTKGLTDRLKEKRENRVTLLCPYRRLILDREAGKRAQKSPMNRLPKEEASASKPRRASSKRTPLLTKEREYSLICSALPTSFPPPKQRGRVHGIT